MGEAIMMGKPPVQLLPTCGESRLVVSNVESVEWLFFFLICSLFELLIRTLGPIYGQPDVVSQPGHPQIFAKHHTPYRGVLKLKGKLCV